MRFSTLAFAVICMIVGISCKEDEIQFPEGSLAAYTVDQENLSISRQLIACAAGGQKDFLEDAAISVFFLPIDGAHEFRYFETKDASVDPDDFAEYQEKSFPLSPVFNGYLQRFLHTGTNQEVWARVSYVVGDSLHICNAIRIKMPDKPSEFAPQRIQVDLSNPTAPTFSWEDGQILENEIYFQVVSDSLGNLISGTYTYDRFFQFYDLSNVVLNIRDVSPAPKLDPNTSYTFTLMGVSIDNWVNLVGAVPFSTR